CRPQNSKTSTSRPVQQRTLTTVPPRPFLRAGRPRLGAFSASMAAKAG
ncbi:MAG: hypothetical protein AVDCRST_MAG42-3299, partial [uncultured Chthoniobacterales bacterium]